MLVDARRLLLITRHAPQRSMRDELPILLAAQKMSIYARDAHARVVYAD